MHCLFLLSQHDELMLGVPCQADWRVMLFMGCLSDCFPLSSLFTPVLPKAADWREEPMANGYIGIRQYIRVSVWLDIWKWLWKW